MSEPHTAPLHHLSAGGSRAHLLPLMESLLAMRSADEFLSWTRGALQNVIPHEMFIGGVVEVDATGYRIHHVLMHDWPVDYFDRLRRSDGSVYSPIMQRWAACQEPQLYSPDRCPSVADPIWLGVFEDAGLCNIASHGLRDFHGSVASYVNFSRVLVPLDAQIAWALELLIPHIHVALTRILGAAPAWPPAQRAAVDALTPRQRDVLAWMLEGKTNWEIARVLGRSEHTVKHHVAEILRKLEVNNRAQAVAKAVQGGLVA